MKSVLAPLSIASSLGALGLIAYSAVPLVNACGNYANTVSVSRNQLYCSGPGDGSSGLGAISAQLPVFPLPLAALLIGVSGFLLMAHNMRTNPYAGRRPLFLLAPAVFGVGGMTSVIMFIRNYVGVCTSAETPIPPASGGIEFPSISDALFSNGVAACTKTGFSHILPEAHEISLLIPLAPLEVGAVFSALLAVGALVSIRTGGSRYGDEQPLVD